MICLGPLIVNVGSIEQNIKTDFVVESQEKKAVVIDLVCEKVLSNRYVKQSPRTLSNFIWTSIYIFVWLIASRFLCLSYISQKYFIAMIFSLSSFLTSLIIVRVWDQLSNDE